MLENYLWFVTINWLSVIITLVLVMIVLNYATDALEEEISIIWKKLRLPNSVRWAIFDASISSLPELLIALAWLIILGSKWLEVGTWTIWWSALFNILIIPAAVLIAYKWKKAIKVEKSWIKRDTIFYLISIFIFLIWLYFNQLVIMSIFLVILYGLYILYLYKQSLQHRKENEKEVQLAYDSVKNKNISYVKIIIALILTYISVEMAVVAAKWIWDILNISVLIVSLVILAWITSIPDTLLSVKSSKKWDVNAWLSNAVGSNIFNICIWLAVPILIWTTFMWLNPEFDFNENFNLFIFVILATVVYFILLNLKNISNKYGYIFIVLYIFMIIYLLML